MHFQLVGKRQDGSSGFTLLELLMVMTIIVILVSIGVPAYNKIQLKARETQLKDDLKTMRKLMDQYKADKERFPESLDELVKAGYLRAIPIDPITGSAEWAVETGEDTISLEGGQGMIDVRSKSEGTGSDGVPYSQY